MMVQNEIGGKRAKPGRRGHGRFFHIEVWPFARPRRARRWDAAESR
jgi:hypothetical protein